jgi:hypothetical protein
MNNYVSGTSIGTAGGILIAALAQPYSLSYATESSLGLSSYIPYSNNGEIGSGANMGAYTTISESQVHKDYLSTVSSFYGNLLSNQEMLDADIERAIYSNLSDLYEE